MANIIVAQLLYLDAVDPNKVSLVTFRCGWLISYRSLSTSFQFAFASEPPNSIKVNDFILPLLTDFSQVHDYNTCTNTRQNEPVLSLSLIIRRIEANSLLTRDCFFFQAGYCYVCEFSWRISYCW